MKRAVITGMGLVSPLGNNKAETLESLKETKSGIKFQEEYKEAFATKTSKLASDLAANAARIRAFQGAFGGDG